MFGWRKKNDGFVWNEYVRTTVLMRRENRRQKIEDVKVAAVDGIKNAGRQSAAASAAGVKAAGRGTWSAIQTTAQTVCDWTGAALTATGFWIADRSSNSAKLSEFASSLGQRLPTRLRLTPELFSALSVGTGLIALVATLSWITASITAPPQGTNAAIAAKSTLTPISGRIEGRAVVVSGDRIKVGPTVVRLSGIEAPEVNQVCPGSGSKTWGCGSAAKSALQKIVGTKQVTCDVQARSSDATAACQVAGADIAGQLVRGGHVFAESGLFPTYGRAEAEARAGKVGIWQGESDRPSAYRAKVWDDAKREAPGGCPIKGIVAGDARSFVMPGAPNYAKTKVRTAKGERWFCSEDEAIAAGWKPPSAS
jgi:endonuclease YncB( thermonuclease family)